MQPYEKYPELSKAFTSIIDTVYAGELTRLHQLDELEAQMNLSIAPVENSVIAMHLEHIVENLLESAQDRQREHGVDDPVAYQIGASIYHVNKAIEKLKQLLN